MKHLQSLGAPPSRALLPETPTKANNRPLNGILRNTTNSKVLPDPPKTPDSRQVDKLKHQVQTLELQMAASERVRRHLETSLRELTSELQGLDGSKASLQTYKSRMAKENERLNELLNEEAQARE